MRESNGQGKGTGRIHPCDSQRLNSEHCPTSGSWMAEAEARMMAKLKNDLKKQMMYSDIAYSKWIAQRLSGSRTPLTCEPQITNQPDLIQTRQIPLL